MSQFPKNKLYYGDNLDVLRHYIKDESIDLCYIDPPFNSKRNYNQIYNNIGKEDKAQAQAFVDTWIWDDFANKGLDEIKSNYNGVFTSQSIDLIDGLTKVLKKGSLLAYLVSMTLRIAEIHRVLKPIGSFYLHCDPTASHYLKLVCDGLFTSRKGVFRNEIIWCYTGNSIPKKCYPKKHDIIFWYSKTKDIQFYPERILQPYSELTERRYNHVDEQGRRYKISALRDGKQEVIYMKDGKYCDDVFEIPVLRGKEHLGYPTQKPEALLERIIKASSNEDDIILDAYCGCGTTIAVAERLNRQWIGIDITYQSISLILKRLEDSFGKDFTQDVIDEETHKVISASLELNGVPQDFEAAIALANKKDDRTRKEFEKWIILTYSKNRATINEKKGGDAGVDGIAYIVHSKDTKEIKKVIFSVKSNKKLSPAITRELYGTVIREEAAAGILLTLYPMPNLVKESKQYGFYHNEFTNNDYPKIRVVSAEDIFEGHFIELPNVMETLKKAEQRAEQDKLL